MKHIFAIAAVALGIAASAAAAPLPQIVSKSGKHELLVDGAPFLILGGELHNSSSSGLAQMSWLVIGSGDGAITFSPESPGPPQVAIESINEEILENGKWTRRRRINGDEDSRGQVLRLFAADLGVGRIYKVRLYRYR